MNAFSQIPNPKLEKKIEKMKEQNNKAFAREAAADWRKHVPVYGWMQVNYPSTIDLPLREKYENEKAERIKQQEEAEAKKKTSELEQKEKNNPLNPGKDLQMMKSMRKGKSKHRVNPEFVNEEIMKEIEILVPIDHSKNFLKNYPENDFAFLKDQFRKYNLEKNKFDIDKTVPHNYTNWVAYGDNKFLYQLGIKKAFTFLTTTDYETKCKWIDANWMFDEKYCTMFPKSTMLGPKPNPNYENANKKVGDISFEENKDFDENLKNLSRLPPENITEEWVKDNWNENVTRINFENCYWLTKDLISKLGRLNSNLQKVSLRNLDLSNYIIENIMVYAKNIEDWNVSNCTGWTMGLVQIISDKGKKWNKLNWFNLPSCVNDSSLLYLGLNSPQIKELNIGKCFEVTDVGIRGLFARAMQWDKIDLTSCSNITNEGWSIWFTKNILCLKEIVLNFWIKITDDGFEHLPKCKQLTHVEIVGWKWEGESLATKVASLGQWVSCNLSGYPKLSDSSAMNIMSGNSELRILRLSNCVSLTNIILESLNGKNTKWLLLEINRTPWITQAAIDMTVEINKPNWRVIRASNWVWKKTNWGLKVPYASDLYVKPQIKGAKKPPAKKNDDKSPEVQLVKLREEMKPKLIYEYFLPEEKTKKKKKK